MAKKKYKNPSKLLRGQEIEQIWIDESCNIDAGKILKINIWQERMNEYIKTVDEGKDMAQEQKKIQGDDKDPLGEGLSYQLPETKNLLQKLEDAYAEELKDEHKQEVEEDEKQDKAKAEARRKKRTAGGQICCCGSPGCYIGPMKNVEGRVVEE